MNPFMFLGLMVAIATLTWMITMSLVEDSNGWNAFAAVAGVVTSVMVWLMMSESGETGYFALVVAALPTLAGVFARPAVYTWRER